MNRRTEFWCYLTLLLRPAYTRHITALHHVSDLTIIESACAQRRGSRVNEQRKWRQCCAPN